MKAEIRIFQNPSELADSFANEIHDLAIYHNRINVPLNIVLSGGSTPKTLFEVLANQYALSIPWSIIHLFWGDERCVTPDHPESNYGMVQHVLLSKVSIPFQNVHRIKGEVDPVSESSRYSKEIEKNVRLENGIPEFDLVMLGIGEDGHTASIFPNQMTLLQSTKICEISIHPQSGQKRITLSGTVINHAKWVVFMVTGTNKSRIARTVIHERKRFYPASHIHPLSGHLSWYLDKQAARGL